MKVGIVGGGLSGIFAAFHINKFANCDSIEILEKSNTIFGRFAGEHGIYGTDIGAN